MDILSVFRPGENLLLDLYDHPEEVIRLIWEIHELWHRFYQEINDVLQPVTPVIPTGRKFIVTGQAIYCRMISAT